MSERFEYDRLVAELKANVTLTDSVVLPLHKAIEIVRHAQTEEADNRFKQQLIERQRNTITEYDATWKRVQALVSKCKVIRDTNVRYKETLRKIAEDDGYRDVEKRLATKVLEK